MTISDIITLVTLIIAILAIISEKHRSHLLLKLQNIDYIIFGFSFLFINYFVFYDKFYAHGIYLSKLYFTDLGINPKNYAYIISMSTLFYLYYKIWHSFYPNSRLQNVIKFYRKLIENGDLSLLLDLIERYHKENIIKLIDTAEDYKVDQQPNMEDEQGISKISLNEYLGSLNAKLFPNSWRNKMQYGNAILNLIIQDTAFLNLTANKRPYLFAEIFAHFKKEKRDAFPDDLLNLYLTELIEAKNYWLINELKQSQNFDSNKPEWFFKENRILNIFLNDLGVADINKVWISFGDSALNEIETERKRGYDSGLYTIVFDDQPIWNSKAYISIVLFNIMIIEAVIKKYENAFWLTYYNFIIDQILKTLSKYPPRKDEENIGYLKLIRMIEDNLFNWLGLSVKYKTIFMFKIIIGCLKTVMHSISGCNALDSKIRKSIINETLNFYCNLHDSDCSEQQRILIENALLKPYPGIQKTDEYYAIFAQTWGEFDKIAHKSSYGDDYEYFVRLKENVIAKLYIQ